MSIIDLEYLTNITGGDNEIMAEMMQLLLEETPKHLNNIKSFQENEQWTELGAEAHKIKPMLLYVGLSDLHEAAQQLEANGKKAENLDEIPELIETIELGFYEVEDQLKEKIEEFKN